MRGLRFFYIIISNTSMEMLAGIPRQTQARTVYQFTARLTPVSSPSEFTASRAAKPCNAERKMHLKKAPFLNIAIIGISRIMHTPAIKAYFIQNHPLSLSRRRVFQASLF